MKKIISSIIATLVVSSFAFAGGEIQPVEPVVKTITESALSGFYVGAGYSKTTVKENGPYSDTWEDDAGGFDGEYQENAFTAILGYSINRFLAIEGRYTTGTGSSTRWEDADGDAYNGPDIDFINIAMYLKPMLPVGSHLTLYGLIGYGTNTHNWNDIFYPDYVGAEKTYDLTANGLEYGAGVSYKVTERFALFADYVQFAKNKNDQIAWTYDDGTDFGTGTTSNINPYALTFGVTYSF
jgi:opacity protein-like surface antigen